MSTREERERLGAELEQRGLVLDRPTQAAFNARPRSLRSASSRVAALKLDAAWLNYSRGATGRRTDNGAHIRGRLRLTQRSNRGEKQQRRSRRAAGRDLFGSGQAPLSRGSDLEPARAVRRHSRPLEVISRQLGHAGYAITRRSSSGWVPHRN